MKAIIRINQNAAVMAGVDNSGDITIDFNPADLTPKQRAELVKSETHKDAYKINLGYLHFSGKTALSDDITTAICEPHVYSMIKALDERIEFRKEYEKKYAENQIKTDLEHKNIIIEWMNGPIDDCVEPPKYSNGWLYKIKYPNRLPGLSNKTIVDSMIDEIHGLKDHMDDLNALIFWLKLDETACKTKNKRIEKEQKAIAKQKELEHKLAKVAQIEKWVSKNGTQNQKDRLKNDMLPFSEIVEAIETEALSPLSNGLFLTEYEPMEPRDICTCEYGYCDTDFIVERLMKLTAHQYDKKTAIEKALPGSVVTIRQHIGTSEGCEQKLVRIGYKVELKVGEIEIVKEYMAA